jgi:pre-mRNA-splicing factor CWC22
MATTVLNPQIPEDGPSARRKRYFFPIFYRNKNAYTALRSRSRSVGEVDDVRPSTRRRSQSPSRVQIDLPRISDVDPIRRAERERQMAANVAAMELERASKPKEQSGEAEKQAEFAKLIGSRSGGVYMPPARLRALKEAAASDKSSPEYQRLSWDALRKSLTGIVNRVNIANIKQIIPEIFAENLIRGRGVFARSIMKAQASSLPFTPVFAAMVSVINTKLPQVGELVLTRLISQFRRSFKRNDKVSDSEPHGLFQDVDRAFQDRMSLNNNIHGPSCQSSRRS